MIDLLAVARIETGIKPRTIEYLIGVARRQILAEFGDADDSGQLEGQLWWPTIRALRAVSAQPILTTEQEAALPTLDPEAFHRWRAGEPAARRSWLGVSWEPTAAHSVRKGSAP